MDAVARAACRDGSLRQACALLGRARAQAGVGITEAMTDVAALYRVLGAGPPPASLDRPGPAIALVQVTDELAVRFTRLRRTTRASLGTEVRMTRLPARPEGAERLLDGLAH